MKNITSEMKISLDEINSILDTTDKMISEFEDTAIETVRSKCRNYILSSECQCNLNIFCGSYMQIHYSRFLI